MVPESPASETPGATGWPAAPGLSATLRFAAGSSGFTKGPLPGQPTTSKASTGSGLQA